MAVHSIAVPPDPARDARQQGAFPAGTVFYRVPSSKPDVRYVANGVCCTCPDAQQNDNVCKHIRAVVLFEASQQPAPAPTARSRYEALFPACRDCGDLADGLDNRCSRCASDREWEARRDARSR